MYEIEWTTSVPRDEQGDFIHDHAKTEVKFTNTIAKARKLAKEVYPDDFYGSVRIRECRLEHFTFGEPGTYLEYEGPTEHYEGE